MSLTINHQTNDISATSGYVAIGGYKIAVVAALPSSPDANTIYFVTG